ncbi:hypothetical protein PYCCODRAFT_1477860 [Trametes coccinea BRFM310]|uniref:Protein kinase domain-containing protein n=1 Tax=Trametes coccinea (strain BRFM310) TaxID=1353009 RepID=A0A1Y2IMG8_TRAC3|nr:hypothetical protein PYCCODRAFT_1477860 [Trametes coccinea BRFM310]
MSDIFGQQIQDIRRDFLTNNRVGRVIVCSRYIPLLQRLREHPSDLLTMVEQITNCLHALFHDAHILHHDVSAHNIMWQPSQSPESEGEFVLCDFDLAVTIEGGASAPSNTRVATATHRTGTLPFLAIELLENPKTLHRLYHDYESLFWVVLWCAMKADYHTEGTKRAAIDELLNEWEEVDLKQVASQKRRALKMHWNELPIPTRFNAPMNIKNLIIRFQALIDAASGKANKVQLEEEDEPGGTIQDHGDIMDTIICKKKILKIVKKARTKMVKKARTKSD